MIPPGAYILRGVVYEDAKWSCTVTNYSRCISGWARKPISSTYSADKDRVSELQLQLV